jgi:hypothetical protein
MHIVFNQSFNYKSNGILILTADSTIIELIEDGLDTQILGKKEFIDIYIEFI